jgi:diguanylate cyclase (GGDEF)-like protein
MGAGENTLEDRMLWVFGLGLAVGGVTALVELLLGGAGGMGGPAIAAVSAIGTAIACSHLLALRQREYVCALRKAATRDPLTGLDNRRGFQERMEIELARAARDATPLTLLILDLDDFKQVNDRLGHLGGDMALERAAGVLRRESRAMDGTARLGGEEFAVVLPNTDLFEALAVAERMRSRVEKSFKGTAAEMTASFGIASFPEDGQSLEELLDAADRAMYKAKRLGKNRCVIHDAKQQPKDGASRSLQAQ